MENYKSKMTNELSSKSGASDKLGVPGKSAVSDKLEVSGTSQSPYGDDDTRNRETEGFRSDWICGSSIFGTLSNILDELRHRTAFVVPKMKILMTAFQIISSLPFNLDVVYPSFSLRMLRSTSFVSFSASSLGSPQCQAG